MPFQILLRPSHAKILSAKNTDYIKVCVFFKFPNNYSYSCFKSHFASANKIKLKHYGLITTLLSSFENLSLPGCRIDVTVYARVRRSSSL